MLSEAQALYIVEQARKLAAISDLSLVDCCKAILALLDMAVKRG